MKIKTVIMIEARKEGCSIDQIENTLVVGELIEILEQFDSKTPIYFRHDNGYTYGSIQERLIKIEEI